MSPSHENSHRSTRRTFLKSTGTLAAGLAFAQPSPAQARSRFAEQLAVNGGPKAVTAPDTDAWRWPLYGKADEDAVLAVLRRPSYDPLGNLEDDWKAYFGVDYCKAHCSGTAALTSMFFALDLPPGSEIMVPSYTFFATIVPMRNFGLVPVFVDIDPHTLNFDLEDAKRRLTKNTRALLPVHWFGNPCDMDAINDWADQKGLIVLEDAAHAHGAKLQGKWMGSWSRMAIFSYQMTKALPALEGGMGVYQEKDDFDRATAYGQYDQCSGKYEKYRGTGLGMKLRMHPVAASLARTQLQVLAERNAAGTAQVRRLNDRVVHLPGLYEQKTRSDCERMYYSTNMLFLNESEAGMSRENCLKALQAEGVHARAYNYRLQHKQPLYTDPQWWHHLPTIPELPGSEEANATSIALPYFTSEQPELAEQYVAAFEKVWAHRSELAG